MQDNNNSLWFDNISISSQGLLKCFQKSKEAKYPGQHIIWTDDIRIELPIKLAKDQIQKIQPTSIIDQWMITLKNFGKLPALSVKKSEKWITLNYEQYYQQCLKFAKALIFNGYKRFEAINIIEFNAPEWYIAYFGSVFVQCIPVGIQTTNSPEDCQYIAGHSQAKLIVAQNQESAKKYYGLLTKGLINKIVIYGEQVKDNIFEQKIVSWKTFINSGSSITTKKVQEISRAIKPGNCATLIYTSGKTGMPKGVMLSHDNFTWTNKAALLLLKQDERKPSRMVSYLPLSHAASQFIDATRSIMTGSHMHIADSIALHKKLIQKFQEVKPNMFFSVPRIWQKIYDKMKDAKFIIGQTLHPAITAITAIKAITPITPFSAFSAFSALQAIGAGTAIKAITPITPFSAFSVFSALQAIGAGTAIKAITPITPFSAFSVFSALQAIGAGTAIRPLITTLLYPLIIYPSNIFFRNRHGIIQSTAPQIITDPHTFNHQKIQGYLQVGDQIPGTHVKIHKQNPSDQEGQICMRGRNIFMGYYKNAEDTCKTIDTEGYLHSGNIGKLTKDNILFITGRLKELIITLGGQEISPVLIENEIKNSLPCISNVMAIGDSKKYLTCLISLKEDPPCSGNLQKVAIDYLSSKGLKIKTVKQAINNLQFNDIIKEGLNLANKKAISRAQYVQQFYLMTEDFTMENGFLTPMMKIKRKQVLKRYANEIQLMYITSKL